MTDDTPKEIEAEKVKYRKVEPKRSLFSRVLSPVEQITRPNEEYVRRKHQLDRLEA